MPYWPDENRPKKRSPVPVAGNRHQYVGASNAFSCSQVCGRPPEDPIHLSFEEQDLIQQAEFERGEAARFTDGEC